MAQTTYILTQHFVSSGNAKIVNQGRVSHTRKWLIEQFENGKSYSICKCGRFKYMGRTACKSVYMTPVSKTKKAFYYSLVINEKK